MGDNGSGRTDTIKFHEFGYRFYWHIPSGKVTNEQGVLVAEDCHNLETARRKVRPWR